jgi:hypothetical protein
MVVRRLAPLASNSFSICVRNWPRRAAAGVIAFVRRIAPIWVSLNGLLRRC